MANNVGRAANRISRLCFTFVNVTTPMAPRTPLPTKFAAAEKHKARHLASERLHLIIVEHKPFLYERQSDLPSMPPQNHNKVACGLRSVEVGHDTSGETA